MTFTKLDLYIVLIALFVAVSLITVTIAAFRGKFPSVEALQNFATVFNTRGGIVLLLVSMWWLTLGTTVCFGVWVIIKGVDPQHGVVITLLGMLISQAFGNVNGALFKTMTGEEPKSAGTTSVLKYQEVHGSVANTLVSSGGE